MADDDIERLLKEIASTTGTSSAGAVPGSGAAMEKAPERSPARKGSGGRLPFAIVATVGLGASAWFVGLVMPFVDAWSAGIGGAFAAFVTALVAGPPRWFSS